MALGFFRKTNERLSEFQIFLVFFLEKIRLHLVAVFLGGGVTDFIAGYRGTCAERGVTSFLESFNSIITGKSVYTQLPTLPMVLA